jgi:hypothetical protein
MIDEKFRKEVRVFLDYLGHEDFGYSLKGDAKIEDKILNYYLPTAQKQPEEIKRQCIEIMRRSCLGHISHKLLRHWKGALMNIIWFCIIPTASFHEIEEDKGKPHDAFRRKAISSIIRFSRWYHTNKSGSWKCFRPYARQIGKLLWDDMEVLLLVK